MLHQESNTLQTLQKDKEYIEKAIGGIQTQLKEENVSAGAAQAAIKQQHVLEKELSRVHELLAENSKVYNTYIYFEGLKYNHY